MKFDLMMINPNAMWPTTGSWWVIMYDHIVKRFRPVRFVGNFNDMRLLGIP